MSFTIPGLGAIPSAASSATLATGASGSASGGASAGAVGAAGGGSSNGGSSGGNFLSDLANAIDGLQSTETAANEQAISVAAGTGNIADYMISAEQATLATQLTVSLTNQATAAFNMIMNMNL
jgi:flagellar hook-basal body complex protein FliE